MVCRSVLFSSLCLKNLFSPFWKLDSLPIVCMDDVLMSRCVHLSGTGHNIFHYGISSTKLAAVVVSKQISIFPVMQILHTFYYYSIILFSSFSRNAHPFLLEWSSSIVSSGTPLNLVRSACIRSSGLSHSKNWYFLLLTSLFSASTSWCLVNML